MTEESVMVICPNPKCGKEIREPMLLTILCVTPPEQYEACPYCFAKLQTEEYPEEPELETPEETEADLAFEEAPQPEELETEDLSEEEDFETEEPYKEDDLEDVLPEDDDFDEELVTSPSFLDRVKSLIPSSNGPKKEKTKETETASIVEPEEASDEDDEDDQYDEAEEAEDEEFEEDDETEELDEPEEDDEEEDYEDEESEEDEEGEEEEPGEEPVAKVPVKTETKQQCPEEFGYLANREKDVPIPSVCYMCPRMVDCMLSPRND